VRARRKSPVSVLTNAGRWLTLKGRAFTDEKDLGEQKTSEAKSWKILFFDGGCVSGVALCSAHAGPHAFLSFPGNR
jgi:hypothetical protein